MIPHRFCATDGSVKLLRMLVRLIKIRQWRKIRMRQLLALRERMQIL